MSVRAAIATAAAGREVPGEQLESAFGEIVRGEATPAQTAALLVALRMKGETVAEIVAAARALRAVATRAVLLTIASWAITYAANYCFSRSLGLPLSFFEMAGISAVCSLVASLPVSIAGAGTRDAALIAILAGYGIGSAKAVALSTLMLSTVLFAGSICALAFLVGPLARVPGEG